MNDNTNLITHMHNDPNAFKHAAIGMSVSFVTMVCTLCVWVFGIHAKFIPLLPLITPLIAGVGIEIVQRIQSGQNTNRESFLDAITTGLWPVYYLQKLFRP